MKMWSKKLPPALFCALLLWSAADAAIQVRTSEEFSTALESVSDDETIEFQAGFYTGVCGMQLVKSVSITGNGKVTLDCSAAQDAQFRILGARASVVISDVEFSNGYSIGDGGCLQIFVGANVALSGCTFIGCTAAGNGGAVSVSPHSHLSMDGCNVLNNSATEGGGVLLESATLDVRGATMFLGNSAERGGGIAAKMGANATMASEVSVSNGAIFQENMAFSSDTEKLGQGGGMFILDGSTLVCSGEVRFTGNEANSPGSNGGALYVRGAVSVLVVGKTTFEHNLATFGGAISAGGGSRIELREGVLLTHNTALVRGGGLYGEGAGTVLHLENDVVAQYGSAIIGGGLVAAIGVQVNLFNNVALMNNLAKRHGAAIFAIQFNTVETRGRVRIHNNRALDLAGGIRALQNNVVNLTAGTTFEGNFGGGIVSQSVLIANKVEFTANHGPALSCSGCTAHINECTFTLNYGGATTWLGGGTCQNSRFNHNMAENGGAVAHFSSSPLFLKGNTFFNNSATLDGGTIYSAQESVIYLSNSTIDMSSAGNNGAAMLVKDEGEVYVSGVVTMQHGTAVGSGGAVHHQGKTLNIQPGSILSLHSNYAYGGGGISSSSAVTVEGQLSVFNNSARQGDGGGVKALGVFAVFAVYGEGWLEVADNEAASGNGGGVALLDNARLTFHPDSACPSSCQSQGDGRCDPSCMRQQCRWDKGDCEGNFYDAGAQATLPCNRESNDEPKCSFFSLLDGSDLCMDGCMSVRCEWGFGAPPCGATTEAIGQCPFLNAIIYQSIVSNPDVRYIKDGGTAGGFGRCAEGTCSAAEPSSGKEEPYCTTVNDGGQVLEIDCEGCLSAHPTGESWGPCAPSSKPRLPSVGFDYEPAELLAVMEMDVPNLFRHYPGCGYQPIAIRRNRAALAGGGIYKDRCDGFLESTDRCFVGELGNEQLPSVIFDIANNHAMGPGGGIFVECAVLDACLRAMQQHSGLPVPANSSMSMMHFGEGSLSDAYGSLATGLPVEIQLVAGLRNATPGQSLVDVSYSLLDSQGQVVRGSAGWPNPHVVEVLVCHVGDSECTPARAMQPAFLLRAHPTDEATSTASGVETLAVCPAGQDRVEIHLRVAGASSPGLHKSVVIDCIPCGPGQEKVMEPLGEEQMWTCRSCLLNEYVVSAIGGCQACPLEGAACDGFSLTPTVDGAEWGEEASAVLRVQACPAGYILVRDPAVPVLDACVMCPPGKYSVSSASYPDKLAVLRAPEAPLLCADCVRGADCLGGIDIISKPDFWEDREARQALRQDITTDVTFYQCTPGACDGNNTCRAGRHGPICGLCKEEWARQGIKCVYCGTDTPVGKTAHIPTFAITVACGFALLYLLTWRPLLVEHERALWVKLGCVTADKDETEIGTEEAEQRMSCVHVVLRYFGNIRWLSPAMIGAFKVAVSFYQVASTFHITFRIDWPHNFLLISSLGRLTGLDLSLLLPSVACIAQRFDYVQSLLVFTVLFPVTVTFVLCVPYLFTRLLGMLYHDGSTLHPKHENMQRSCLRAVLLWFFLIYPTVSEHTLATFFCQDLGSGGHVLVMDQTVDCPWGGTTPSGGFYFALFLVFVYPIGIPVFFYYVISAFSVPAMAAAKYRQALFSEMIVLYRKETSTPASVRLAQHLGLAPGSGSGAVTPSAAARKAMIRAGTRLQSDVSESAVPLQSFRRRVSQLFTQTFVERELSGIAPKSSVYDKLDHVMEQLNCSRADMVRLVAVLQRLSINPAMGEELDAFEQLASKIAHNHFLFIGHETLDGLSLEQLQALFLFDWEGLNRKRSDSEIRKRKVRRQRLMRSMDAEDLRTWVARKARELEKTARIKVPDVNWNGESEEEERALGFVGLLFDDFRVQTWWFFLLGEVCKLIMTSVLVFIPGQIWQQLAWGFFVQVCITTLYVAYHPMAEPWLNHFQIYALVVQAAILFFGCLLAVSDSDDAGQQHAFEHWATFLVILKWSLVFFPLVAMATEKAASSVHRVLQRMIQGGSQTDDTEPGCLESLLFPTASTSRLRRASTQSSGLHQLSMSEEDLSRVAPSPPLCTTPGTQPRTRADSTVDAELVSANIQQDVLDSARSHSAKAAPHILPPAVTEEPVEDESMPPHPIPDQSTLELSMRPTPRT